MVEKIFDRKKFSMMVEEKAIAPGVGYMDVILSIIEEYNLDFSDINSLLTPSLKQKLEAEAIELNYMKGGNTLPL